jgi:hypothetical protein
LLTQIRDHSFSKEENRKLHEETFKRICEYNTDRRDANIRIENEKCENKAMKRFLEQKYDKRLAQKILILFDWLANSIKFDSFTNTV